MSGSYSNPFIGYPAAVFSTCWQSASWLANLLQNGVATAASVATPALAVFQTLMNGADSVAAWQTAGALTLEQQNMAAIQALPLSLDPTTSAYFNARVNSIAAAASGLTALLPSVSPFAAVASLAAGNPAVPNWGFLEWCAGFSAETPPAGLTAATLVAASSGAATAWLTVTNAISVLQGAALTTAYDTAARQYRVASVIASGLAGTGGFTQSGATTLWNGTVAMPSLLLDAGTLMSSPAYLYNQEGTATRYALRSLALQIAFLLLSLRSSNSSNVTTAVLRRNESLMDLAARAAGGFGEWSAIATLNNLQPPWPGPTNPALAQSGTPLLMPGSSLPASGVPAPTYANNVLGIDYDTGPINGTPPAWTGDIPLIIGYANLARALGRRLQTPLGALIYHPDYGSRIPPEVGAIQSQTEASRLAAFGRAALSADPRVASISSAVASVQPGFLATFSGTVIPVGPGAVPVSVNEVISPLP